MRLQNSLRKQGLKLPEIDELPADLFLLQKGLRKQGLKLATLGVAGRSGFIEVAKRSTKTRIET